MKKIIINYQLKKNGLLRASPNVINLRLKALYPLAQGNAQSCSEEKISISITPHGLFNIFKYQIGYSIVFLKKKGYTLSII